MAVMKFKTADKAKIRKDVDLRIPRARGAVTFCKNGKVIESVYTSNMREIVYERMCGWDTIHIKSKPDYADFIQFYAGMMPQGFATVEATPQNEIHCPY